MDVKDKKDKAGIITTTYICPKCQYTYNNTFDLNRSMVEDKPEDQFYELDRRRFCLTEEVADKIRIKISHVGRMADLHYKQVDRTENSHIYNAAKEIKRLKITQLAETLQPKLEKSEYGDFKLGEPQMEQSVIIGFSCLDRKADRTEYDSRMDLQKLIKQILENTNWRLMSDGINYRLGYLSGRLRAYESEEDLRHLVEQQFKDGTRQKNEESKTIELEAKPLDMRESALVYFQNLTYGSEPVDKNEPRGDYVSTFKSEFNDNLRVVIPARENNDSVPEFVRNFDFVIINKTRHTRKTAKKKQEKP